MDKIASVNGLRGLAILAVIYHHAISDSLVAHYRGGTFDLIVPIFFNGWTGVNLFFILSGFVLYLPYASKRRSMLSWSDVGFFYKRRFLRLMPLYYFAAAVVLVIAGSQSQASTYDGLTFDLLTVSRLALAPHHFGTTMNYPLWSIAVEVLFSLVFPIVVIATTRLGFARLLAAALIVGLGTRIAGRLWVPYMIGPNFISDNLCGRIDEFIIGMLVAKLHVEGKLPYWTTRLAYLGAGLVLFAWEGFYQFQYRYAVLLAPMNNFLDIGFALLLAAALVRERDGETMLTYKPLQLVGMMCYSLYIWHAPILDQVGTTQGLMAAFLLLAVLASFTYRYIEFGRVADWRGLFLLADKHVPRHVGRV